ncbi:O-antigen polymerase [Streptococcus anginosus]|uniref:O-antigen polymerase n=1 Tax=Streptococcus anginosus TaxID=1328 RepID=UPI0022E6CD9E|nr:O-antigen polymerase [Streptococcus anginosus]
MSLVQIGIAFCFIVALVAMREERTVINPLSVFCFVWMAVLFFSTNTTRLDYPQNETIGWIIIGVVAYTLGYIFQRILKIRFTFGSWATLRDQVAIPRYKLLLFCASVCMLFFLRDLILVFLNGGSFNLRYIQQFLRSSDYTIVSNPIENTINLLFIQPIAFALPAICAVDIFYGEKNKHLITITVLMLLFKMMSTANRSGFLLLFIYILIVGLIFIRNSRSLSFKNNRLLKRYKYLLLAIVIIASLVLVITTISRGVDLSTNIYLNLAIPPRMFEIWSKTVQEVELHGYGETSLMGFLLPIKYIFNNILKIWDATNINAVYNMIQLTDVQWVWPGPKITANAYVSMFWNLYTDFRYGGILVGSFLYGTISAQSFWNAIRTNNPRMLSVFCLILYSVLYSFVRFQFSDSRFVLAIIFISFFAYKKDYKL